MSHLYEVIARRHDLRLLALALLVAGAGAYAAQNLLAWRLATPRRRTALFLAAVAALGVGAWLVTELAVKGMFPFLAPTADSAAAAIGLSSTGALLALTVALRGRPGYRDSLLAGAILACSVSCMLFLGFRSLAHPFRLAYGPVPITVTVLVAAVLNGFGLAQVRQARGRWQVLQSASCLAAAQLLQVVAGLSSVLSFTDWISAADQSASFATDPVVTVVIACGLVVLALGVFGSAVDHYLALQATRWRQLADCALEGILIHCGGMVLDANAAFCVLIGRPLRELRGRQVNELFQLEAGRRAPWLLSESGAGDVRQEVALRAAASDIPVEAVPRRITYRNRPAEVLAIRDIREQRKSEARIRFLAHHDGLTGLANRMLFDERIELALGLANRSPDTAPVTVTVLCLDLDRFKAVNDSLGHAAGDLLLRQVAARLREATRATDTVARVGGDEFIIMQTGVKQPQAEATQAASILAARLIEALSAPFDLGGKAAGIGVSIGIALSGQNGSSVAALLRNADLALYRAKTDGRGAFRFYEPAMDAQLRGRQTLEQDLRAALDAGQIAMHYQPILACEGGEVSGFEALMRWTHPSRGSVPPSEFIPLAEQIGLIGGLGAWALEQACAAAVRWPPAIRVAVNLSPAQFHGGGLAAMVAGVLERTGLPAVRLELELTEGAPIKDTAEALAALDALTALGIAIVLDDFGSGYSSFGHLRRFAFTRLKIDHSFVAELAGPGRGHAIVLGMLAMSRSLGIDVIAEGVETAAQLALLRAQGCGMVQGALFGDPMPAEAVRDFLQDRPPLPPQRQATRPGAGRALALVSSPLL